MLNGKLWRALGRTLDQARGQRRAIPGAAPESAALRALTAAALALPGLAQAGEGDDASFQYGYYKESERNIYLGRSAYDPIRVNNLNASGHFTLLDRWKLAFNFAQDTWSGATPITSAPLALGGNNYPSNSASISGATPLILGNGSLLYDRQFNPYRLNLETGDYVKDTRLVQTIATASPETRHQGDFSLTYAWDEAAATVSGGISEEPDYHSAFAGLSGRMDFNQKLTTLNLGVNYNNSDISALLDPNASPYYDSSYYADQIKAAQGAFGQTSQTLRAVRQDWSTHLSLTQVLNKDALIETGFNYTRSTGYQANPYKVVDFIFVDPNQTPVDTGIPGLPALLAPEVQAVLERRPDIRNQYAWNARYAQYVEPLDAALHFDYRFYHDDWDISAHTFFLDWSQPIGWGWTVTPRFRYYSQTAASFYQSYFLFKQAEPTKGIGQIDLSRVPLDAYSSDYRLSGFGALSGGITVEKRLGKALKFEAGFEYYAHRGDLKLGGGGEGSFTNFDYYQFNAGLKLDLSAPLSTDGGDDPHAHHHHHGGQGMAHPPAGVMFGHMLEKAGDAMVGYRYMYDLQAGDILNGTRSVGGAALVNQGCGGKIKCSYTPTRMSMNMHMLDLMYAPTDWLNLMLMPQFVSMDMEYREINGASQPAGNEHNHGGDLSHVTGGVGDIGMYALFKLFEAPGHHLHTSLGFTAPSGDAGIKVPTTQLFYDYGMQLGSGTWDFRPSLTYLGQQDRWSWGGQISAVKRLESRNEFGYVQGDVFQSTLWGGYSPLDWLSATVRGLYTSRGAVKGQFKDSFSVSATFDIPANFGGHFWDVGLGVTAMVPEGVFKGHQFAVEWLQPVYDDFHGYQVERVGSLSATWQVMF